MAILGNEFLILGIVVIIFLFGYKKIPELARSLGRAKGEFDKGKREIRRELKAGEPEAPTLKETDLIRAAKDLGIETKGKTEDDLRKEIQAAVKD